MQIYRSNGDWGGKFSTPPVPSEVKCHYWDGQQCYGEALVFPGKKCTHSEGHRPGVGTLNKQKLRLMCEAKGLPLPAVLLDHGRGGRRAGAAGAASCSERQAGAAAALEQQSGAASSAEGRDSEGQLAGCPGVQQQEQQQQQQQEQRQQREQQQERDGSAYGAGLHASAASCEQQQQQQQEEAQKLAAV